MKKLLAIAAMSALASLGAFQTQAGTWDVLCVNQGPRRGFVPGFLKVGGVATLTRSLTPASCIAPAFDARYPDPIRSKPCEAKVAEMSDAVNDFNFISLGFGGSIVLAYSDVFGQTPGPANDLNIYETTWGDPGCTPGVSESAKVEFSQDGVNWEVRQACHNGYFEIAPLLWAKYVRITDQTNPMISITGDGVDAFDVDGIGATSDYDPTVKNPECDYRQGCASQFVGTVNEPINGFGVAIARGNFALANINEFNAAVVPSTREASGWINFWSLGFKGHACFQLPYAVYAAAGPDFKVYETTWNNSPCPNYPERANVYVSVDATPGSWVGPYALCKDGTVDFGNDLAVANYIKLVDVTIATDFGPGADGFDIDNIFIFQDEPGSTVVDPCAPVVGGRRVAPEVENIYSEGGVPEEMFPLTIVGSNVISDKIAFTATIAEAGDFTYSIRNHTGQELVNGNMGGNLYENPTVEVPTGKLASGVYFLTMTSPSGRETVKFIKK